MKPEALAPSLARALVILRVTLGMFLLQWGVEKFVVPANTPAIWGPFYGVNVPLATAYLLGAAEIAIAVCVLLGVFRTVAYGAGLGLHTLTGDRASLLAYAPRQVPTSSSPGSAPFRTRPRQQGQWQ